MINFDEKMKKLRSVNGYLGSAILNYSGETLYVENESTGTDIAYSATIFNDTFRTISETSLDIGFSEASSVEAKTDDGHVFLVKSAGMHTENQYAKIAIFCIFRDDGNIALAKMIIDKSSKAISDELSRI
jgi:hypothetical protein